MADFDSIFDLLWENAKNIFYPEEWFAFNDAFSKSELLVMVLIAKHNDIIMSQLANEIHVPMSTATGIIERLVKNGYLTRDRDESDRRIVVVKLTDRGRELVQELRDTATEYIKTIDGVLTEEERQQLSRIFIKIVTTLKQKKRPGNLPQVEKKKMVKIDIE